MTVPFKGPKTIDEMRANERRLNRIFFPKPVLRDILFVSTPCFDRRLSDVAPPVGMKHADRIGPKSIEDIIETVCRLTGYNRQQIVGDKRQVRLTLARHIATWTAATFTIHSTTMIGRVMRRDHSTIVYARQRIDRMIAQKGLADGIPDNARDAVGYLLNRLLDGDEYDRI